MDGLVDGAFLVEAVVRGVGELQHTPSRSATQEREEPTLAERPFTHTQERQRQSTQRGHPAESKPAARPPSSCRWCADDAFRGVRQSHQNAVRLARFVFPHSPADPVGTTCGVLQTRKETQRPHTARYRVGTHVFLHSQSQAWSWREGRTWRSEIWIGPRLSKLGDNVQMHTSFLRCALRAEDTIFSF